MNNKTKSLQSFDFFVDIHVKGFYNSNNYAKMDPIMFFFCPSYCVTTYIARLGRLSG